ncbi:TPM domain-containing protein [Chryseobacterium sp.]|uniref:TPM domain-containing protein n=1 Tax=Chryseobacterium sp. TaxID=1871047 RepID=UPI0011CACDDA|nr:TPM domain-containing protein [Chryseobacterium sp.]TXF77416.1 TPM domain-containing protein [Chryseobacterium sp.]
MLQNLRNYILIFCFLIISGCKNSAQTQIPSEYRFENQIGYVNDYDDLLTLEQENNLEKILSDYDLKTTNEIGVVTVKSIKPYTDINQFGDDVLTDWRFGKDDKFNGLLIIIDGKERMISIRFGTGIMKTLSNEKTQHILDDIITKRFKEGRFYEGITDGIEHIATELKD